MSKLPTIFETKWPTVLLSPIMVDDHVVMVSSTIGLHPNQIVTLKKAGIPSENFVIRRILSDTELQVGKLDTSFVSYEIRHNSMADLLKCQNKKEIKWALKFILGQFTKKGP
jgi:hypothetical protein